jgi:signal transduction histidine kinase
MNDEKNEFMGLWRTICEIPGRDSRLFGDADGRRELAREIKSCASRINETARRMSDMVRNLLDANRIERGDLQVNMRSVNLAPLVKDLSDSYQARAAAKQQT